MYSKTWCASLVLFTEKMWMISVHTFLWKLIVHLNTHAWIEVKILSLINREPRILAWRPHIMTPLTSMVFLDMCSLLECEIGGCVCVDQITATWSLLRPSANTPGLSSYFNFFSSLPSVVIKRNRNKIFYIYFFTPPQYKPSVHIRWLGWSNREQQHRCQNSWSYSTQPWAVWRFFSKKKARQCQKL